MNFMDEDIDRWGVPLFEFKADESDFDSVVGYFDGRLEDDQMEAFSKKMKKAIQSAKEQTVSAKKAHSQFLRVHGHTFKDQPWSSGETKLDPKIDASLVIKFDGKFYAIDGQHRMNHRIALGMPVPVVIIDGDWMKDFGVTSGWFSGFKIPKVKPVSESFDYEFTNWIGKEKPVEEAVKLSSKDIPHEFPDMFDDAGDEKMLRVSVTDKGKEVAWGKFGYHPGLGEYVAFTVEVSPKYRRQGLGTKMYDYVEKKLHVTLHPFPGGHSNDANKFWGNRISKNRKNYPGYENWGESVDEAKLVNWSMISMGDEKALTGTVSDHPEIEDGHEVVTSPVVSMKGKKAVTRSGTEYDLESADKKYDASVKGSFDMLTKFKAWIPEGKNSTQQKALNLVSKLGVELSHEGEDSDFTVVAKKGGKIIGSLNVDASHSRMHPNHVEVDKNWRRKGIGTAMYVYAELETGNKFSYPPDDPDFNDDETGVAATKDAVALWDQPDRPFGETRDYYGDEK